MIKSRAAVAFAPNKPLEIVEVDVAPLQKGEVLVRIVATGVCHTDAYTLSGADSKGIFPGFHTRESRFTTTWAVPPFPNTPYCRKYRWLKSRKRPRWTFSSPTTCRWKTSIRRLS
ncbi:hypothetical protein SAMN04488490_2996 [Marinobacter sp. LV10R510-11A]|nr:hypothetical protein SAMN04488490_2996 [Marinobacter sp. LV10R510-11A]